MPLSTPKRHAEERNKHIKRWERGKARNRRNGMNYEKKERETGRENTQAKR